MSDTQADLMGRDSSDKHLEDDLRAEIGNTASDNPAWKPNQYHASDIAFLLRLLDEERAALQSEREALTATFQSEREQRALAYKRAVFRCRSKTTIGGSVLRYDRGGRLSRRCGYRPRPCFTRPTGGDAMMVVGIAIKNDPHQCHWLPFWLDGNIWVECAICHARWLPPSEDFARVPDSAIAPQSRFICVQTGHSRC